jgi:hypothetical protein
MIKDIFSSVIKPKQVAQCSIQCHFIVFICHCDELLQILQKFPAPF